MAELVDRTCGLARRFASALAVEGYPILNDVVINQVLVGFGERTPEIVRQVQEDGVCWCGGTVWRGQPAMRISVCSWATTETDVDRSVEAICRVARRAGKETHAI
jgi:threonine aldolase